MTRKTSRFITGGLLTTLALLPALHITPAFAQDNS